jgi:2-dehydro-3-deoxygluconokinase
MSGRIVCLGELLLRLSAPGREMLLQSPRFAAQFGGAEANVGVSLARFGHAVAMASVVPDNPLGQAAIGELRRHGVDTSHVLTAPGRMGLYFLVTGAIHRSSEVLYDRAGSSFALHAGSLDADRLLEGADALHVSGVTPALGAAPAAAATRIMEAARSRGLAVSFDCNYRAKLWESRKGDAPLLLRQLTGLADTVFGNARDLALILGRQFGDAESADAFRQAGAAALAEFPSLQRIATTVRLQQSVDHHEMTAWMTTRAGQVATRSYAVGPIVDRIGAGDAFAAGVLHGLRRGMKDEQTLHFGLAAACLKHSVPGDFNLVTEAEVRALMDDAGFGVRR